MTAAVATRPLRVGIDVREWMPGRRTGIGRYLANLVGEWSAPGAGVEMTLYGNQDTALPPGPRGRRLRERLTVWWDQVTLARALRADRVDVFLSPYYKAPLAAPCPVVVTIHDLLFLDDRTYRQRGRRRLFRAAFLPAARAMAARAARIVADSEHSRDDVVRLLRVPAAKVRVVPVGLPSGHRRVEDAAALARVRARHAGGADFVLYVGNFKPHKNVDRLLAAYAALPAALRARFPLVLAGGDAAGRPAVEARARALALDGAVRLAGFVDDADLAALYSAATAVVLPSLHEGFGLPVAEAMACGTAVVCARGTALAEVAGEAAVLVEPTSEAAIAAGLRAVLEDAGRRRDLAARGLARAARFTAAASAAGVRGVLEEAVAGRRP
jgi:glycosyltransferase involved in cell wall biosynthesis